MLRLVDAKIRASDKDLPVQGDDNNKVINREKATPSPKLDQEDMDILNSIVPEPSIVIVPEPPKQQQCGKLFEILNLKRNLILFYFIAI